MITLYANEGSNLEVGAAFYDKDDVAMVPSSISWSLYDEDDAIVNSREDVNVSPASEISILLYGDDLPADDNVSRLRIIITALYTDGATSNIPLMDRAIIIVSNLP